MNRVDIGAATLYLGDCMDILPTLPQVDAVVTDPPYGIGLGRKPCVGKETNKYACYTYPTGNWDDETVPADLLEACIAKGKRAIVWGGHYYSLPPQGGWLVWDKEGLPGLTFVHPELAWTNLGGNVRILHYLWSGYYIANDIRNGGFEQRGHHPAQKPIGVMEWCIGLAVESAMAGRKDKGRPAVVLDPFMGSGTTGVACVRLGHAFIGIEKEPAYFDTAVKRITAAVEEAKGRLFAAGE